MATGTGTPAPSPAGRSVGRFLLKGGAWVGLVQVLGAACAVANQMLLARLLAPEALAAFFLIQSVVMTAAHGGNLGLPRPVTRLIAAAAGTGNRARVPRLLRASVLISGTAGITAALLYSSIGSWLARDVFHSELMAGGTLLGAVWIVAIGLREVVAGALRGLHRVGFGALVAESSDKILLTLSLGLLLLIAGSQDFRTVLAIVVAVGWTTCLLGLCLLAPEFRAGRADRETVRVLLGAGLPLAATGAVHVALNLTDLWVVGWRFTQEDVALYGAAKRLIQVVGLPLMLLRLVLPPVVAELHARGERERLQRIVRGTATLAGLPAIALLLTFMAGSEFILGLAFGDFYRAGAPILVLLCVEQLVFVYVGPASLTLLMSGHETAVMKITISMGFVTVGAVLLGAHLLGFVGVAAGFVVGSTCHQLLQLYFARRLAGIRTDMNFRSIPYALDALRRSTGL